MGYKFGLLRTDKSDEATAHNIGLLGDTTLGIEVTLPVLAEYCGLGNIDPQHSDRKNWSAIETALTYDISSNLEKLVTVRLDKDSVGAMAVLELRSEGKEKNIDTCLVLWIGALDSGPYRDARERYPELAEMFDRTQTDAMNAILGLDRTLGHKVFLFKMILVGKMSKKDIDWLCRQNVRPEHQVFYPEMFGNVAFFEAPGQYREAREFGNKHHEVAVIFDPVRKTESGGIQKRWCVVRQPEVFDRVGFEDTINSAEAETRSISRERLKDDALEWGGPRNLVVSPPGAGNETALSPKKIIGLVREHLESGIVT